MYKVINFELIFLLGFVWHKNQVANSTKCCVPVSAADINGYRFSYHLQSRRCSQGSGSVKRVIRVAFYEGQPDQTPENIAS